MGLNMAHQAIWRYGQRHGVRRIGLGTEDTDSPGIPARNARASIIARQDKGNVNTSNSTEATEATESATANIALLAQVAEHRAHRRGIERHHLERKRQELVAPVRHPTQVEIL